jgi:hypothetical protein
VYARRVGETAGQTEDVGSHLDCSILELLFVPCDVM